MLVTTISLLVGWFGYPWQKCHLVILLTPRPGKAKRGSIPAHRSFLSWHSLVLISQTLLKLEFDVPLPRILSNEDSPACRHPRRHADDGRFVSSWGQIEVLPMIQSVPNFAPPHVYCCNNHSSKERCVLPKNMPTNPSSVVELILLHMPLRSEVHQ